MIADTKNSNIMKKKLIKIKSISDAITNSSTEVFLVKNDDKFKEFSKDFKHIFPCNVFATGEDVKNYFKEIYNYNNCYDAEWLTSEFLKANPFANYDFVNACKEMGKSYDEVWNFVKDCYEPMVGCLEYAYEDNCCSDELYCELSNLWDYTKKTGGLVDRI